MALTSDAFVPALVVVDMQEDFCPPNGSLAVAGGRDLAPIINGLLDLPFTLKVATTDSHPSNHISFAMMHPPPNNKPFEDFAVIANPTNPFQTDRTRLWPVHCVQGTRGAEIIPEIDRSKLDIVVEKGLSDKVEMYSVFADMFGNKADAASIDLAALLKEKGITHVYTVGLAGDYCVRCTALAAKFEGFEALVIQDGTKSVDEGENGWGAAVRQLQAAGVSVTSSEGPEVQRVRSLAGGP